MPGHNGGPEQEGGESQWLTTDRHQEAQGGRYAPDDASELKHLRQKQQDHEKIDPTGAAELGGTLLKPVIAGWPVDMVQRANST
ncbi:hypothetical protein GCM10009854_10410 [Saccharopolyspora halophila]|uniref:Uncharacterized protein n=1 Tax=Saccharopolyspora halophila TaxID=405551 RepID=A0ABN3FSB2_9PSEU